MTLDGTNSYVLAAGPHSSVVIDPGPADAGHLATLADTNPELILITHHHADHTEGSAELHRLTCAPVRAIDVAQCHGGEPLRDGELIEAAGVSIRVLATPGHTADSVCFVLPDAVLTGDTILGRGTTVLDGSLADYLSSLTALRSYGDTTVLPGHGQELASIADACDQLIAHRDMRLGEVRAALAQLGADATVPQVTDAVYPEVDARIRFAAEQSVRAQLDYLRATTA
jgi:glyoxylase-like metal-dependent hydrolase (beta-lactamase superfamily II)